MLHNKWLLGGLAVAAAAGGFVLYRRSQAGGGASTAGSAASNTSPAYSGGVGAFDSTGTDVAGWLGSYSGNLQNQLDQFAQQQSDFLSALSQMQTTTPGSHPATAPPPLTHRIPPRYRRPPAPAPPPRRRRAL